ncbi:uncharacterized protein LOC109541897 [Dendroctonus ponderosae]
MASGLGALRKQRKPMTVGELSKWLGEQISKLPSMPERPFCFNLFYPFDGYFTSPFFPGETVTSFGRLLSEKDITDQLSRLNIAQSELKSLLQKQLKEKYLFHRGDIYLQSERLYITTCIRKCVLIEALHKKTYLIERPIRPVGPVFYLTIEQLRWTSKETDRSRAVGCVLYYRTNVYCTALQIHDDEKVPTFIGPYIFKDAPADFQVTVKFFMMTFDNGEEKEFAEFLEKKTPPIMTQVGFAIVDLAALNQGFTSFSKVVGNFLPNALLIKGNYEAK